MTKIQLDTRLRSRLREAILHSNQDDFADEVAIRETIRFYYPDLDEKEIYVCQEIIYMLWDLDGLRPMDELVYRVTNSRRNGSLILSSEAEVLNTISVLKEKSIIFDKFTTWTITLAKYIGEGSFSFPKRIIGFVIKPIEDQALTAMGEACIEKRDIAFTDHIPLEELGPL